MCLWAHPLFKRAITKNRKKKKIVYCCFFSSNLNCSYILSSSVYLKVFFPANLYRLDIMRNKMTSKSFCSKYFWGFLGYFCNNVTCGRITSLEWCWLRGGGYMWLVCHSTYLSIGIIDHFGILFFIQFEIVLWIT